MAEIQIFISAHHRLGSPISFTATGHFPATGTLTAKVNPLTES